MMLGNTRKVEKLIPYLWSLDLATTRTSLEMLWTGS